MELLACCWLPSTCLPNLAMPRDDPPPHAGVFLNIVCIADLVVPVVQIVDPVEHLPRATQAGEGEEYRGVTDDTAIADVRPQASCCVIG